MRRAGTRLVAIMIFDKVGHHLGDIPRAKSEALARLMDTWIPGNLPRTGQDGQRDLPWITIEP